MFGFLWQMCGVLFVFVSVSGFCSKECPVICSGEFFGSCFGNLFEVLLADVWVPLANEEANRGKPNWEHLEDNLHILIQCEDTEKRARSKLEKAVGRVKKLLVPTNNGIDELKRKQLMELSIINGTYRSAIGPKNSPSLFF
ncbi:unnamed protein product [Meloidogyne enterolobii]|uniref:Uncharacterized protein n=1 Tax=Meloidogyne enterolobii TaxID=390850 RepID=A0ACB1AN20_MELEN